MVSFPLLCEEQARSTSAHLLHLIQIVLMFVEAG
jgi:hypothetical protein